MRLASTGLLLPLGPPAAGVGAAVDLGVAAEEVGFESVWVGDHMRWHTPVMESFSVLGALTAATSRARLGTAVLLAGLRHPVETANALATLDHLSNGRLVAGFGVGTDAGGDFRAVGMQPSRRGELLEKAVPAIRALLEGEALSETTGAWSADASPGLASQQKPVPVILGGHSDAALDRATRLADGWIGAFVAPEGVAERGALLDDRLARHGRSRLDFSVLVVVYTHLAATADAAEAEADTHFRRYYRQPATRFSAASVFGPPELLGERLTAYRRAGVDGVVVAQAVPQQEQLSDVFDVARDVFPEAARVAGESSC